nr:TetR-like C-terminal domain-containing protein [uncultured Anaerotignum sp.]
MEKQDRRVIRSKMRMREALIALMQEKPFPEITAKDITEQADLNRATFYLHYNNVFDLLEELEEETVSGFACMLEETPFREDFAWETALTGKICDYIIENQNLCRCLFLNPHSDCFAEKLTEIMKHKGQRLRQERGLENEPHQMDYIRHFISCGAVGMVKQWLAEGMPLSKEEMMALSEKIMHPMLKLLLPVA